MRPLFSHTIYKNEKKEILGVVFLANTHMGQFVPEYLLVYIATSPHYRGQGIGYQLIEKIQQFLNAPIALHVEYDNPAVKLSDKDYEKIKAFQESGLLDQKLSVQQNFIKIFMLLQSYQKISSKRQPV